MKNRVVLASAAAALFVVGAAVVNAQTPAKPADGKAEAAKIKCDGVNACKGQSACKTEASSCKGQNACKSLGFTLLTDAECKKALDEKAKAEKKG